ncbi:MAG: aspartyl-phosphate phosphatase Spo0E family protein [Firmicutes bacterium]|nr:aspartyl-phosphate phosphatase Spo0E family protein [Bacillota bacterium]
MSEISDQIRKLRKELADLANRSALQEDRVLELSRKIDSLVVSYLKKEGGPAVESGGEACTGDQKDLPENETG